MKRSEKERITEYILNNFKSAGSKITNQRKKIILEVLRKGGHLSADELYNLIRKKTKNIGYATVYRTLKIMKDTGIIRAREFGDGRARFEIELSHHDHMICIKCKKVIEFECKEIERYQEEVSSKSNFKMITHKLEIYGLCSNCRNEK